MLKMTLIRLFVVSLQKCEELKTSLLFLVVKVCAWKEGIRYLLEVNY